MRWTIATVTAAAMAAAVWAGQDRPEARHGKLVGTFLRLVELKVGERERLGIEVKLREGEEKVTLVIPPPRGGDGRANAELAAAARALREGQAVMVVFVADGGQRWVQRIEAHRKEGEGEHREGPDRPKVAPRGEGEGPRHEPRVGDGERPKHEPRVGEGERRPDRPGPGPGPSPEVRELHMLVRTLMERMERLEVQIAALRRELGREGPPKPGEGGNIGLDRERKERLRHEAELQRVREEKQRREREEKERREREETPPPQPK